MSKLIDIRKVKFKAGDGGDGLVSFAYSKPTGGDGGKGGDVYLEGSTNLYDLSYIKKDLTFAAENADKGGITNMQGKNGKDLIFKVPLLTKVLDLDGNEIMRITEPGERKLLLKGGIGGIGNYYYRSGQQYTLYKFTPGKPGEEMGTTLELNLQSDVIFIGLPNAGKSSVLNELTNAHSKVGAYPFTTLDPHLGTIPGLILMDLPGLIEGTFEGKGLGTKFLKHALPAKLVAHFISFESEDPIKDYKSIRAELERISPELAQKPEVIVLTKSDLVSKEQASKVQKAIAKLNKKVFLTSAYDLDSLEELEKNFRKELEEIKN